MTSSETSRAANTHSKIKELAKIYTRHEITCFYPIRIKNYKQDWNKTKKSQKEFYFMTHCENRTQMSQN